VTPRIETLCTGDELLTGLISDTNSTFFQNVLLDTLGLNVRRGHIVGDVREDIIEAIVALAPRCDAVLISGGLGPTADDVTAECAAAAAGVPLVENSEALAHLEARFASRKIELTDNNRRQAMVPQGASVIMNAHGSAPMFVMPLGRCLFYFVPGVPIEYRHLVETHVIPKMQRQFGLSVTRTLRVLKTLGIPESHLDARLRPLAKRHRAVTFGYRTTGAENHVKLLGDANAVEDAALEVEEELKDAIFGTDEESLAQRVLAQLRLRGETLATCESLTGGLLSAALCEVPGASEVFIGGAVTYCDESKVLLASVPLHTLQDSTAVSAEVALAMATGIAAKLKADWGVSTTGIAGPTGGTDETPIGTAFTAVVGPGVAAVKRWAQPGTQNPSSQAVRLRIRTFITSMALNFLRLELNKKSAWSELNVDDENVAWKALEALGGLKTFEPPPGARQFRLKPEISIYAKHQVPTLARFFRALTLALQKIVAPGESIWVLDWNHSCYALAPHLLPSKGPDESWSGFFGGPERSAAELANAPMQIWKVPVLPDGDFVFLLARDLSFGTYANPRDGSFWVFGAPLLAAFDASEALRAILV
jgi:nicotinamide-nucleotide amidase